MKRFAMLALSLSASVILFSCGGEKPGPEKGAAAPGAQPQEQKVMPMGKPVVEVPEAIKGKWKGVVLVVEDKDKKSLKEHTAEIGKQFKIPGSDLSVVVQEFFPSFVMQGTSITSTSNEPNNPAAQVVVSEGGVEVFNGWLFARYPTTHAFSHPKFAITLKQGVPK
ncbi:MAG TPA: DUF2155 domain-containing protein [Nitrospirota bacterium]|nr:DUF2155 domain-containing protein [Nitrospirota bacterium]